MLRGGWFSSLLENGGECRCVGASLHYQKKRRKTRFLRLLDSFAAAEIQLISKNNIPIRISETIQSTQMEERIHLHDIDIARIMLLLYLPPPNKSTFLLTPQNPPLLFIAPCNSFQMSLHTAANEFRSSARETRRILQYQFHNQQYHVILFMDCARPNHGLARARSTNVR